MRFILILVLYVIYYCKCDIPIYTDNEFAEFEVADDTFTINNADSILENVQKLEREQEFFSEDDDVGVNNEKPFRLDEEFADEFEAGIEDNNEQNDKKKLNGEKQLDIKPLTFADVPAHFRSNWSSYQVEALTLVIIFFYVINYVYGKTRNSSIAFNWFTKNRILLEQQFALVGDNGVTSTPVGGHLIKETDSSYAVWCSGRAGCESMLTQIKLKKRQDLLSYAIDLFYLKFDHIIHKVELDKGELDSFVFIFGQRKPVINAMKELTDLQTYCVERKNSDRFGLPTNFIVFAEIAETISSIIDATTLQFIKNYEKYIQYFHFSDQYSGCRPTDSTPTQLPDIKPTLHFSYYLYPDESEEVSDDVFKALNNFTFFMIERLRRYRLSKEGKNKADKKRQSVEENFLKTTHFQRQEAAQARREEKTRERKQRVMEEEDPEKQRRLEKLEQKREQKLRQPRMKQIKIK